MKIFKIKSYCQFSSINNIKYPKEILKKSKIILDDDYDRTSLIKNKESLELSLNYLKENNFKVKDDNCYELSKNINDWYIKIIFQCPVSHDDIDDIDDNQRNISEEIELEEEYIPIIFILKRNNKENHFFINSEICKSELYIKEINTFSDKDKCFDNFKYFKYKNEKKLFDFEIFDDDLQIRFMNFLNELEIDQTLIEVIETLSFNKDKCLFDNWVKSLKDEIKNI